MVCGIKDLRLHFEASGIEIHPIELNSYVNRTEFDYARIRVTREAGDHLLDHAENREPVSIYSDNVRLARHYLPDMGNNISITEDDAYIRLEDELKVLQHRMVDEVYKGTWEVYDIVDDLFKKGIQEDSHGVLASEWEQVDVDLSGEDHNFIQEAFGTAGLSDDEMTVTTTGEGRLGIPIISDIADIVESTWRNNEWSLLQEDANYNFENVSVWDALYRIFTDLSLDVWVSKDGVLKIGDMSEPTDTNIFVGGMSNDSVNLSSVNVSSTVDAIKEVYVRGGDMLYEESGNLSKDYYERDPDGLQIGAKATRRDIDDGRTITKVVREVNEANILEQIAVNTLIEQFQTRNTGSITIDTLSSYFNGQDARSVKGGDIFVVEPHDTCRRGVRGGAFVVDNVHHRLSNWEGWTINLDVIPLTEVLDIEVSSYEFNPLEDEFKTAGMDEFEGQLMP